MTPQQVIGDTIARLVDLARDPPFRFTDTHKVVADAYARSLTNFKGYTEAEVAAAEESLGRDFSHVFRQYLLQLGRARGDLFRRNDVAPLSELLMFRQVAIEWLGHRGAAPPQPPADEVAFMRHEDREFFTVVADGAPDSLVREYAGGEEEATVFAASFASLLDAELWELERDDRYYRRCGGYFLRINRGAASRSFPAEGRPLA